MSFIGLTTLMLTLLMPISASSSQNRRTIILAGPRDVGQTTLAKCIVQGDNLPSEDDASWMANDELLVIETGYMAKSNMRPSDSFRRFQQALAIAKNNVDLFIFIIPPDRKSAREVEQFFLVFQDDVFDRKMICNTVLVCSNCRRSWLERNRAVNVYIDRMLNMCGNRSVEFMLSFDTPNELSESEQDTYAELNARSRVRSINALRAFVNASLANRNNTKVNLRHVQTRRFKGLFVDHISAKLQRLDSNVTTSRVGFYLSKPMLLVNNWLVKGSLITIAVSGVSLYGLSALGVKRLILSRIGQSIKLSTLRAIVNVANAARSSVLRRLEGVGKASHKVQAALERALGHIVTKTDHLRLGIVGSVSNVANGARNGAIHLAHKTNNARKACADKIVSFAKHLVLHEHDLIS